MFRESTDYNKSAGQGTSSLTSAAEESHDHTAFRCPGVPVRCRGRVLAGTGTGRQVRADEGRAEAAGVDEQGASEEETTGLEAEPAAVQGGARPLGQHGATGKDGTRPRRQEPGAAGAGGGLPRRLDR